MARGVALDLLQMAKQFGPQYEATERAVMMKSPNRRVWPTARAPLEVMLSLTTRRAIKPYDDDTVELSMKAPMSVSKPADLG